jgi:basic amino acid/polyamine antiporter, APA family
VDVFGWTWRINGGQIAAALAIVFLTAVNYVGLREGAGLQNAMTVVKVGSLLALAGLGFLVPAAGGNDWTPPVPLGPAAIGVALIAVLWSYDGWYCATFSAGETLDPGRNLPRGLLWGIAGLVVLYVATNVVYLRALPVDEMAASPRVGEAAATALFGPVGGRMLALAIVVSTFGCLSSNILTCARIYQPMAEDGLFFRRLAAIHPRHRTPAASLVAQGGWSCVLAFTGTYEQLYTYVVFAGFLFHAATGLALFSLRRHRPDAHRPYRTWGYPVVPALFVLVSAAFVANTLRERPTESLWGLALIALGIPAYLFWRRRR